MGHNVLTDLLSYEIGSDGICSCRSPFEINLVLKVHYVTFREIVIYFGNKIQVN